jgi:hypothetical protein
VLKVLLSDAVEFFIFFIARAANFPLSYKIFLNLYFIILHNKRKDNGDINTMAINIMEHILVL